jgi:AcrR family transcriptional regulator
MTKISFKGFARRKKRKQDRRDSIAQAAIRVMCEKGYEQTTMQDIAEAADFSTSSVYYYFESKIAILEEVITILTTEFSDTVENSLSVESSKEFNLDHYVDQINYFRKINLVSILAEAEKNPQLQPRVQRLFQNIQKELRIRVSSMSKTQGIEVEQSNLIADMIFSMGFGVLAIANINQNETDLRIDINQMLEAVKMLLLNHPKNSSKQEVA